jgi:flagellar biosynthesis/type III secretory pathway M-ring protein FliF/YscJ
MFIAQTNESTVIVDESKFSEPESIHYREPEKLKISNIVFLSIIIFIVFLIFIKKINNFSGGKNNYKKLKKYYKKLKLI